MPAHAWIVIVTAGCTLDVDRLRAPRDGGRDAASTLDGAAGRDGAMDVPVGRDGPSGEEPVLDARPTVDVFAPVDRPLTDPELADRAAPGDSGDTGAFAERGSSAVVGLSLDAHPDIVGARVAIATGNDLLVLRASRGAGCAITLAEEERVLAAAVVVRMADVNADGIADVVFANGGGLIVRFGDTATESMVSHAVGVPTAIDAGDVDADGLVDLVLFGTSPMARVYRQDQPLSFDAPYGPSGSGVEYRDGLVADVDGDNDADLAMVIHTPGGGTSVTAIASNGMGSLSGPRSVPSPPSTRRVAAESVTGGLHAEVVAVGGTSVSLVSFAMPAPTFSAVGAVPGDASDVVFAELDGVPPREIVVGDATSQILRVFSNDGAGNLTVLFDVPVNGAPTALAAADVDGDGRDELFVLQLDRVLAVGACN